MWSEDDKSTGEECVGGRRMIKSTGEECVGGRRMRKAHVRSVLVDEG